jgi:hypothetical protein
MDILKTPQQKLLEEAGAVPASPGMVHTPQQMLMNESGIMPRFADGGAVQMSPEAMLAELIQSGQIPQYFASGGQVGNMSPEFLNALYNVYQAQPTQPLPQGNMMAPGLGVLPFLKSYQT